MKLGLSILLFGGLVAGAAACDTSTDITGGRYYRSFSFQRTDSVLVERIAPTTSFRTIILNGVFQAPTSCQDLKPQIDDDNRNLVITITATAKESTCAAVLGHFHYNVVMGTFFPGSWHVEVVHKDARGTRTVYAANIIVTT
jgi:hypothetical protein